MIYRVLKPLSTGHKVGDLSDGNEFKDEIIDILLNVNAISPIQSPPLSEIPGWRTRAEKLEKIGVITVQDFLEADPNMIKDLFNYKTLYSTRKWMDELKTWVSPGKESRG